MATDSHAEKCEECSRMCQARTEGTVKPKSMGERGEEMEKAKEKSRGAAEN